MSDTDEPQYPGDMRRQVELTLDNVEIVLRAAGMSFANVVQLNTHTTDISRFMAEAADYMATRLAAFDIRPRERLLCPWVSCSGSQRNLANCDVPGWDSLYVLSSQRWLPAPSDLLADAQVLRLTDLLHIPASCVSSRL